MIRDMMYLNAFPDDFKYMEFSSCQIIQNCFAIP